MTEKFDRGIAPEVRQKILDSAKSLMGEIGKIPSVDLVRRHARVDMNATTIVMREFRREASAMLPSPALPEVLEGILRTSANAVLEYARNIANESLEHAKQNWDDEKGELLHMQDELSLSFDKVLNEAAALRDEISELQRALLVAEEARKRSVELVSGLEERCYSLTTDLDMCRSNSETLKIELSSVHGELRSSKESYTALVNSLRNQKT